MGKQKQIKERAQNLLMDCISVAGYKIDSMDLSEEEKEQLRTETKKQMDRIGKMFGFDEAWWS